MTEAEIKEFFGISTDHKTYNELRKAYTSEQIESDSVGFITEILKRFYGFPISFVDEYSEEFFKLSEEKSQEVYAEYAQEIIDGIYEDLYDFTMELSSDLRNFPEE